jgi:hypothetical protein
MYRFQGKQKTLALGTYPLVSLIDARAEHLKASKLLAEKIDPSAVRRAEKQGSTFEEVARLWLEHWRKGVSDRHAGMVERRMKADIITVFGNRQIATIEAADCVAMARRIDAKGNHETARRALEVMACPVICTSESVSVAPMYRYRGHRRRLPSTQAAWSVWEDSSPDCKGRVPLSKLRRKLTSSLS